MSVLRIYPSTAAVEAWNQKLLHEQKVIIGAPGLTLRRLTEEIHGMVISDRRLISPAGRHLTLERLVHDYYRDRSGHFSSLRPFPGFVTALDSLFGEFKQVLVSPSRLLSIASRMEQGERLQELGELFTKYVEALRSRRLMDRHDMETEALEHLRQGGNLPEVVLTATVIEVRDIYDFTPLQIGILAELSRRRPVKLFFPDLLDRPSLFSYCSRTLDAFEALDDPELHIEIQFVPLEMTFVSPLLTHLFGDAPESGKIPSPTGVDVVSAPGSFRECEEIGRRIRMLLENGMDPGRIAVLFRSTGSHGEQMEDICRRFRIPVSFRRGASLLTSSLVRTFLSPFAIIESNYEREELLALVKSSYFPSDDSFADKAEELLLASRYIDASMEGVSSRIQKFLDHRRRKGRSTADEERVAENLLRLLQELKAFEGEKTVATFTLLLETFIKRHGMYRMGIEGGESRALKRDASAIMLFRKVIEGLNRDMEMLGLAEERVTPGEMAELIRRGATDEYLAGERSHGVSIMNFHDARCLSFDHVFIGGLTEGVCPPRLDAPPLMRDTERLAFNRAAGKRHFRLYSDKGLEEPLLFYLALSVPRCSLTLSTSYTDPNGGLLIRSPFLEEVTAIADLPEMKISINRVTAPINQCREEGELLETLAHLQATPAGLPHPLREDLSHIRKTAELEQSRDIFFRSDERKQRASLSTPYTGSLQRDDILDDLKKRFETPPGNTFAPTALEEYGSCPHRFFLKRLVGILPLEKPDLELEVKEEGILGHRILHAFYTHLKENRLLPLRGDENEIEILRKVAEQEFSRYEQENATGNPLIWESEKTKLVAVLERLVTLEGEEEEVLLPEAFEWEFPPFEIEEGEEGKVIYLTGTIDRIDVAPSAGALRVVDYKMAANGQRYAQLLKKDAMGVTSHQMPVYLVAAAREMQTRFNVPFTSLATRYWLLRKGEKREGELGADGWEGFFATALEERQLLGSDNFFNRICEMVGAMKGGDFQVTPREECGFCGFSTICRYVQTEVKETGD